MSARFHKMSSAPPNLHRRTSENQRLDSQREKKADAIKSEKKARGKKQRAASISFPDLFVKSSHQRKVSLFEEAAEATLFSAGAFAIADLRSLALEKNKVISDDDASELLKLPMTVRTLRRLQNKHLHLFEKFNSKDFADNLLAYRNRYLLPETTEVHYVGDEMPGLACVHVIARSFYRQAITLTFRGSVTINDWIQDIKLMIAKVPNPLEDIEGQPKKIGIHSGFKNFIAYSKSNKDDERADGSGGVNSLAISKREMIINQLRELKLKYPTDPIYICGHSLGGALSLIMALEVASDPILGSLPADAPPGLCPVTCFAVANPKPGDGDFCNAIEYLERQKRLRCCIVHSTWDLVPMLATNMKRSHNGFHHPGWKILLYSDRCEIGRSMANTAQIHGPAMNPQCCCSCQGCRCHRGDNKPMWNHSEESNILRAARSLNKRRTLAQANRHDHRVYLNRLINQENHLRGLHLDSLYDTESWKESV